MASFLNSSLWLVDLIGWHKHRPRLHHLSKSFGRGSLLVHISAWNTLKSSYQPRNFWHTTQLEQVALAGHTYIDYHGTNKWQICHSISSVRLGCGSRWHQIWLQRMLSHVTLIKYFETIMQICQCFISHVTRSGTKTKLFLPLKSSEIFQNYFSGTEHAGKYSWAVIILWNNYEIISGKFLRVEMKLFHTEVDEGWNNF